MAKMTLLEIVQDILNDMDSDAVNSISDTVEAQQVAQIVKTTFYNILDGKDFPHKKQVFQLQPSGDVNRPNYMIVPDTIETIEWIKYNTRKVTDTRDKYLELRYMTPQEFLALVDSQNSAAANIKVVTDFNGIPLNIRNDKAPQFYTSFDDVHLIFDSYDAIIDTTLQQSKSSCQGKKNIVFTLTDTAIPDLPIQMFSYLLNEAKSTAFLSLKQTGNSKAEQHSVSQRRRMSQEAWKVHRGITYPDYGRKRGLRQPYNKDLPPRK